MRIAPPAVVPFVLAALAVAQGNGGPRQRRDAPPVELKNLSFREDKFHSDAVDRDVPYAIYLPKGYDDDAEAETKWPLVIWLHGMFEDHMRFHHRAGEAILDEAIGNKALPPCVFVLAEGGRTSMYVDAGKGKDYQQLVEHDLLAHVEKTYRVSPDRRLRALMGISMGGMAALRIGFSKPELFGIIAVHSSAVFPVDPKQLPPRMLQMASQFGFDDVFGNPIDEKLWAKTNPLSLAADVDPKSLDGMRLYFDAGTEDRFQFHRGNTALHELLEKRKIEHTWNLVEGGGHAWNSGFQDSNLRASLKFVGDAFRAAAAGDKPAGKSGEADGKGGKAAPAPGDGKR
ncbi:MAG: alpha/beta hydrolase-fold protein [Planctomycetota bacterium]